MEISWHVICQGHWIEKNIRQLLDRHVMHWRGNEEHARCLVLYMQGKSAVHTLNGACHRMKLAGAAHFGAIISGNGRIVVSPMPYPVVFGCPASGKP